MKTIKNMSKCDSNSISKSMDSLVKNKTWNYQRPKIESHLIESPLPQNKPTHTSEKAHTTVENIKIMLGELLKTI